MNKEESDKLLIEIHGDLKVVRSDIKAVRTTQESHGKTLFGVTGDEGIVKDLILVKDRQAQCPARKAATTEGKRLTMGKVTVTLAIIALVVNLILSYLQYKN